MLVIYTTLCCDFLSSAEAWLVTSTYNCAIKSHKYVVLQNWDVSYSFRFILKACNKSQFECEIHILFIPPQPKRLYFALKLHNSINIKSSTFINSFEMTAPK